MPATGCPLAWPSDGFALGNSSATAHTWRNHAAPSTDEIVMAAGTPPIVRRRRAITRMLGSRNACCRRPRSATSQQGQPDDWTTHQLPARPQIAEATLLAQPADEDPTESERRQQPELNRVNPVEKKVPIDNPFEIDTDRDEFDDDAVRTSRIEPAHAGRRAPGLARPR